MSSNEPAPDGEPAVPADPDTSPESTPLFDETLQTLPPPDDDVVAEEPDWPTDDPRHEVDEWYGASPPEPGIDPQTREGRAILRLFRLLKEGEVEGSYPPGRWNGGDTVETVSAWLTSLGIDPAESPVDAGARLTLAARSGPALHAVDYTVEVGSEHADVRAVIIAATSALAEQLGPGTVETVLDTDGRFIARHEHPEIPASS